MRIIVQDVRETVAGLSVKLDRDVHDNGMGRRALRVLIRHAGRGHGVDQNSVTMFHGQNVAAINTLEACQAEIDRWANARLTIQFSEPRVFAYGPQNDKEANLPNMRSVRRMQAHRRTIGVNMHLSLSLPVINHDLYLLDGLLEGTGIVHPHQDDLYGMGLTISLQGELLRANPWKLIRDLKPQILTAIV